jgi:hypothetical protein
MNLLPLVEQAHILAMKFDAVIANPPYMGNKYLNPLLKEYLKKHYKGFEKDLFSASMIRNLAFAKETAQLGFMTPLVWMFISSYENLRNKLIDDVTIISLIQPEYNAFWDSAHVPICCFTLNATHLRNYTGSFIRLTDFYGADLQPEKTLEAIKNPNCGWFYNAKPDDFKKISGSPVAYWVGDKMTSMFANEPSIQTVCYAGFGIKTGDNNLFMRMWSEVNLQTINFSANQDSSFEVRWYPCASGGNFKKWYGNQNLIVNFKDNGKEIETYAQKNGNSYGFNAKKYYFKRSITWSKLTSSLNSFRETPEGHIFDGVGLSAFFENESDFIKALSALNTNLYAKLISFIAPTLSFTSGDFLKLPFPSLVEVNQEKISKMITLAKTDWNNYETSWDFTENPLIRQKQPTLKAAFEQWQTQNRAAIDEMKRLEEENNRLFIDAYGLQDELSPDVPEEQITLIRADREKDCCDFISYAVGCLFGRYSLDKTGLILASQGETLEDYLKQIPEPTLMPCENNVLPIIDGDWFADDISERFREFLRVSFGEAHYEENLHFIEESLGKKIGQYFVKDFYSDHIKRYKKRPIYWLFSSPKGSFNALIYLHRYRADTVSVVLNEYLREFRTKLSAQKSHLEAMSISSNASQSEKTKALKEIEKINKMIVELEEYEREVLYPLATEQKVIDLDDGVKVNYCKFGTALKKIAGLDAQDD